MSSDILGNSSETQIHPFSSLWKRLYSPKYNHHLALKISRRDGYTKRQTFCFLSGYLKPVYKTYVDMILLPRAKKRNFSRPGTNLTGLGLYNDLFFT